MTTNGQPNPTLLETMLRLHGDFRTALDALSLTPLQAGLMLYVQRNPGAGIFAAAKAFGLRPPTLTPVVQHLVRRRYVSRQEDQADRRGRRLALKALIPYITKDLAAITYR